MSNRLTHYLSTLPFIFLLSVISSSASAQIEEIVVTSSFRSNLLSQLPVSASIISANSASLRGATHIESILNKAPNVNFASGASRGRFVQIRGIGELEQFVSPISNPSVGVLVDGINYSGIANVATLLDTQQVEILRGPQGTRFGVAAAAGVINVISNQPTNQFEGNVAIEFGNFGRERYKGTINLPINDSIKSRVSVQQFNSDGYIENIYLNRDDTNNIDEFSAKAIVNADLEDNGQLNLILHYNDQDNGYDSFSLRNDRRPSSDSPGEDNQESLGYSLSYDTQLANDLAWKVAVNGETSDLLYSFDEDWCNLTDCSFAIGGYSSFDSYSRDRSSYSFETTLASEAESLSWIVGIFHRDRDVDLTRERIDGFTPLFVSEYSTQNTSVFGNVEYQLDTQWSISGGLRIERFNDDYSDSASTITDLSETLWGGDLNLNYKVNDNQFIYFSLARGFKAGGENTEARANSALVSSFPNFLDDGRLDYGSETLVNIEIGGKFNLLDDRLVLNAALFHTNRNDAQIEASVFDPATFVFVGYLDNAAEATNQGFELEANYQLLDNTNIFLALGLLDTELSGLTVIDVDAVAPLTLENREQANAPRVQLNLGTTIAFAPNWTFNIELDYKDEYFFAAYHQSKSDSFTLLHAAINYQYSAWQVKLWGRNITDRDYAVRGFYFGNELPNYLPTRYLQFGDPAVYGVSAVYNF